jgi:hypothetical protein
LSDTKPCVPSEAPPQTVKTHCRCKTPAPLVPGANCRKCHKPTVAPIQRWTPEIGEGESGPVPIMGMAAAGEFVLWSDVQAALSQRSPEATPRLCETCADLMPSINKQHSAEPCLWCMLQAQIAVLESRPASPESPPPQAGTSTKI